MQRITRGLAGLVSVALLAGAAEASPPALPPAPPPAEAPSSGRTGWFGAPILGYAPETGLAYGGAVIRYFALPGGRDSVARADARYTTREQLIIRQRNRIYWDDNFLRSRVSYERFPDFYFGLGPTTPDDPEDYTPVEWRGELEYERRIWSNLYAGGAFELVHVGLEDVVSGGLLDSDTGLVGRGGGWQSGLGVQLTWDDRDNVNATREGSFGRASLIAFHPKLGSDYAYRRATLDLRHFIPLGFDHVLAVQALGRSNTGQVPFYDLALMGGRRMMRGIYEGRLRDRHLLAFQAEYRLPVWWRFGLAAFVATAQVGNTIGDLDFRRSRFTGGGGLRFAISEPSRLNARIDVGASREGAKFYFTFNEAF